MGLDVFSNIPRLNILTYLPLTEIFYPLACVNRATRDSIHQVSVFILKKDSLHRSVEDPFNHLANRIKKIKAIKGSIIITCIGNHILLYKRCLPNTSFLFEKFSEIKLQNFSCITTFTANKFSSKTLSIYTSNYTGVIYPLKYFFKKKKWKYLSPVKAHLTTIVSMVFFKRQLITASSDKSISIWKKTGKKNFLLKKIQRIVFQDSLTALKTGTFQNTHFFLAGTTSGSIHIYKKKRNAYFPFKVLANPLRTKRIAYIQLDPKFNKIYSVYSDGNLQIWKNNKLEFTTLNFFYNTNDPILSITFREEEVFYNTLRGKIHLIDFSGNQASVVHQNPEISSFPTDYIKYIKVFFKNKYFFVFIKSHKQKINFTAERWQKNRFV
jgi:WD40 repeat protein